MDGLIVAPKQLSIQSLPAIKHGLQAVSLRHMQAGQVAHAVAFLRCRLHRCGHCTGQRGRCAAWSQPAGTALHDHIARARNIGGNRGQGASPGFEQAHGQPFPSGRENKGVRGAHPRLHIRLKAKKANAALQSEIRLELAQFAMLRAIACDDQPGRFGDLGEGVEEGGIVLYGFQAAGGKPQELVFEAEFLPRRSPDTRIRVEILDVYPVRKY